MEGGLAKSASAKLSIPSIKTNIIRLVFLNTNIKIDEFNLTCFVINRFLTMDDAFLLENRLLLRAM